MSREHDFAAPPTPGRASFFSRFRDSHVPHRLATVDHRTPSSSNTSPSAALSAAFSPSDASPTCSRRSPASRPYDPRQWSRPGAAGGVATATQLMHATNISGMEGTWRASEDRLEEGSANKYVTADTHNSQSTVSSTAISLARTRIHAPYKETKSATSKPEPGDLPSPRGGNAVCTSISSNISL